MIIIRPISIPALNATTWDSGSILTASNVPEDDHPEYSAGTTYADGDKVIVLDDNVHRIYESLQGANTGNYPPDEDDTEPPVWWLNLGAVNRWKMFDGGTSTQTQRAGNIEVELTPGVVVDALALFSLSATQLSIVVDDPTDGQVYNATFDLTDNGAVTDWYAYFFEPIVRRSDYSVTDLPPYGTTTITVTLTGSGTVQCGLLVLGKRQQLGATVWGSSVGIVDYSRKETDAFGNFMITERRFAKLVDFDVQIDTRAVSAVQRSLAAYRATPIVYQGADPQKMAAAGREHEELIVYGYYRDFSIVLATFPISNCTIQVEGL